MVATPGNAMNLTSSAGLVLWDGTSSMTASAPTNHAIMVGTGSNSITSVGPGSTGQVFQANTGADPTFSTATYPSVGTSTGSILRADGTNWSATTSTYPNTNAINTLLYASASNVMSALATANGGVLVTSNTGVPSILAGSGTSGQVLQAVSGAAPAWSTPTYPSTSGSAGVILRSDGTNYVATTSTYPNTNAINTLLYASSANVMSALATANGGVLATSSTGVPSIDTTNFAVLSTGLQLKGNNTNTAPPAGFIGQQISSVIGSGSPVSLPNNTATTITSIVLTAGIWDISCVCYVNANGATWTRFQGGISLTNNAQGTNGDNYADGPLPVSSVRDAAVTIPSWRQTLSGNTTIYMTAQAAVTVANGAGYGRLSATRVG
jgi:hypothetical protein